MKLVLVTLAALVLGSTATPASATVLLTISNVDVSGTAYDVDVVRSACTSITIFNDCNDTADFQFSTQIDAEVALAALGIRISEEVTGGTYTPADFCDAAVDDCYLLAPYLYDSGEVLGAALLVHSTGADVVSPFFVDPGATTIAVDGGPIPFSYAVFNAQGVPLPGSGGLLLGGLFVAGAIRRRRS